MAVHHVPLQHLSTEIDVLEINAKLGGILHQFYVIPVDNGSLPGVFRLLTSFLMPFLLVLDGGS